MQDKLPDFLQDVRERGHDSLGHLHTHRGDVAGEGSGGFAEDGDQHALPMPLRRRLGEVVSQLWSMFIFTSTGAKTITIASTS